MFDILNILSNAHRLLAGEELTNVVDKIGGIRAGRVPTILREGPYRFYFVSGDGVEPPHVHVRRDRDFAKFWLKPVILQDRGRFGNREIRHIRRIVEQNQAAFLEAWHGYFND